ncbi:Pheromone alpha factor receptor [Venturia nashicola]|uniref:Pheromone alpha factor receptor n=1 Tax=Venturia nashicola TaxID=86259 RepID=A0A4Z1P313_9PEZI|nr:Pheromone alpha factor receptor [Venturia nashicola]
MTRFFQASSFNVSVPVGSAIFRNLTAPFNTTSTGNITMAQVLSNSTGFLPGENGYTQTITLLFPDGSPFNISMSDLVMMNNLNIGMGLSYGIQIGLASLMLIVTLLLSRKGKRRSLIFFCNVAALALDIPISALMVGWLGSIWNNPYVYFTHDTSRIAIGNVVASILPQPLKLLEIIAIQLSLFIQVRVILFTCRAYVRRMILAILFTLATICMAMEIGLAVINAKSIALMADPSPIQPQLAQAANITFCIFVASAMAVFVWKLAHALKNRRNLGVVKFGPMQVIFIMGAQTMVAPALLSMLNLVLPMLDLVGLTFTVTAVSLPLSGLWASTVLEPASSGGGKPPQHQQQQQQYRAQVSEASGKMFDSNDSNFTGTTRTATSETELMDFGSFLSDDSDLKGKSYGV